MQANAGLRDGPGLELLASLWDREEGASERDVCLVFFELKQLASTCMVSRVVSMGRRNTQVEPDLH